MKEINIYADMESWLDERPNAVIKGTVNNRHENYIEILDENGYTQMINISKIFAIVY